MWLVGIRTIFLSILKLLVYWFNPKVRERRRRGKVWAEFKNLEKSFRMALSDKDPQLVARIGKEMKDLRGKYRFLSKK